MSGCGRLHQAETDEPSRPPRLNGITIDQWLFYVDERHSTAHAGSEDNRDMMSAVFPASDRSELTLRTAAIRMAAGYCLAYFVAASVLWGLAGTNPVDSALGKCAGLAANGIVAFGMTKLLHSLRAWRFAYKVALAFALACVGAPIFLAIEIVIYIVCMYPVPVSHDASTMATVSIEGLWLYFGWLSLFLALSYSFQIRASERRLAAAREEALSAQMRALRYQVNPHFLFNTLNSMAGLIEEGANQNAHDMVMRLSAFLRSTLSLDPLQDVRLQEEIELQSNYLSIEHSRFADRMKVNIEIDENVRDALVPSLILQPLVENAVKHGVGQTPGTVEIEIKAERINDLLNVTIENDAVEPQEYQRPDGTGIGLRNVVERISARFPELGACVGTRVAPGRFRATLTLPYRMA